MQVMVVGVLNENSTISRFCKSESDIEETTNHFRTDLGIEVIDLYEFAE